MQALFTQVNISDMLQFMQKCDFYNKIFILNFYVRQMGR